MNPNGNLIIRKAKNRDGRCYELAGAFILDNDIKCFLIHGKVQDGERQMIAHAWVEANGKYWDPVFNDWFDKFAYTARCRATVEKRYSRREACWLIASSGRYGPWTGMEEREAGKED